MGWNSEEEKTSSIGSAWVGYLDQVALKRR